MGKPKTIRTGKPKNNRTGKLKNDRTGKPKTIVQAGTRQQDRRDTI